ncbi:fimbrial biogenesis chaperone [Metapseudomonas otitidis]|uniref:fimbrial biogenesis chaperone n=1 Tax=Metapseudomonas otitidis TaxID=319939 RepID=UPI00244767FA|nr:fimbria/pilus periplasmic chaperone [Pseudomonas otitidis]MDH0337520.1 fimbria/pilus periplasmic chaperone [Pseudomonas otitidis]
MSLRISITRWLLAVTTLLTVSGAHAGIVVNGTRFIYPAKQQEIGVRVSNDGDKPSLVQVWIDRGDPEIRPENAEAPFVMTPPLFRVDPGKGQSVRVSFTGEPLPKDRESVFWLNLLDVPPMPSEDGNYMQFAIRTRVKLFYRPEGLPGRPDRAIEQVAWSLASIDGKPVLRATNRSAYNVSFGDIALRTNGRDYKAGSGMVGPFGSHDFPVTGLSGMPASGRVVLQWINDYGASVGQESSLDK